MDIGLLLIFLCAGSWFYAGVMLALADGRWNRARVLQYALCSGFCVWLLVSRRTGPEALLLVLFLLAATFFLPWLLRWRIHEALLKGRTREARGWEWVLSLLEWRSPSAVFPAVERIYEAVLLSGGPPAIIGGAGGLVRLMAAPSRKSFVESRINAWTALRECGKAIELFEANFGPEGFPPDAGLLCTMVIPYSESGDLKNAARCLRRAEEMHEKADPQDVRRFVAYLHVYAQAGRVYAFERLVEQNSGVVAAMPPAYVRLWRGVALLRHGEPEVARNVIASAIARQRPGEEWIGRIAQRYAALPPADAAAAPQDPETAADLDAIEAQEQPAPSSEFTQLIPDGRPLVTWGLMAVCVLVFLLTEGIGSSEDSFTLAQLGANVPSMVRLGDWWRLVSSIFLHVGPMHLVFNLLALYLFGPFVERLAGRWEMFVVFMVSGICGSAASAWLGSAPVSAGASGAICGLLGAATIIALTFRGFPKRVRRIYLLDFLFLAAITVAYGWFDPHIDNLAHFGGLVSGALVGLCLRPGGNEFRRRLLFRLAGGVMAAFALLTLWFAAGSVEGAGYPAAAVMRPFSSEAGRWSIEVPRFWQVAARKPLPGRKPLEVVFDDPYGAVLEIQAPASGPVRLPMERGETLSPGDEVQIGRYTYEKYTLNNPAGDDENVARSFYITTQRGRNYLLVFECERSHAAEYAGLVKRILAGFEVRGAGPAQPRRPQTAA